MGRAGPEGPGSCPGRSLPDEAGETLEFRRRGRGIVLPGFGQEFTLAAWPDREDSAPGDDEVRLLAGRAPRAGPVVENGRDRAEDRVVPGQGEDAAGEVQVVAGNLSDTDRVEPVPSGKPEPVSGGEIESAATGSLEAERKGDEAAAGGVAKPGEPGDLLSGILEKAGMCVELASVRHGEEEGLGHGAL